MKLKEKFEDVEVMFEGQEGSLGYDELYEASNQCVEIAEDFAIGFAEWISEKTTTLGGGLWMMRENKLFVHKNQLLEIYKKENEL